MASSIGSESDSDLNVVSQINVTPFVDVVLVLLVIFMVTAPLLARDLIKVQLPKTQTSDGSKLPRTLGIGVNKEGQIFVDGILTSEEELISQVKALLATQSELQAVISADIEASYGKVARVIDLLKVAGLERFALQVIRDERSP